MQACQTVPFRFRLEGRSCLSVLGWSIFPGPICFSITWEVKDRSQSPYVKLSATDKQALITGTKKKRVVDRCIQDAICGKCKLKSSSRRRNQIMKHELVLSF